MPIAELPSPCGLVDLDALERNCARMRERAANLGVSLRPHVKTHKTVEIARLQTGGVGGVTVSTLAEARGLAAAAFDDVLYAVPISPARLREAADLARRVRLGLLLDGEQAAAEVERCAAAQGLRLDVLLKVDCGGRRAGVDPAAEASVAFAARLAASPHLRLRGVLTHAGHAYRARSSEEATAVAAEERDVTVRFADRARAAGVAIAEVSVGSTPTLQAVDHLRGVTEARPGNYAFFDAFQAAIGSCTLADVAFTVLARVIGVYPERNEALVDAGALALSKDAGPTHVDPACGFGIPLALDGRRLPARLVSLTQEHGLLRGDGPLPFERLVVGTPLRIVPNHSCLAAACFDRLVACRAGEPVASWPTLRGW